MAQTVYFEFIPFYKKSLVHYNRLVFILEMTWRILKIPLKCLNYFSCHWIKIRYTLTIHHFILILHQFQMIRALIVDPIYFVLNLVDTVNNLGNVWVVMQKRVLLCIMKRSKIFFPNEHSPLDFWHIFSDICNIHNIGMFPDIEVFLS